MTSTRFFRRSWIFAALALSACGASGGSSSPSSAEGPSGHADPSATPAVDVQPAPTAEIARPPRPELSDRDVGRAVNGLAGGMLARLAPTPGNLVFSPASMEAALAMTAAGARGETALEMQRVLGLAPEPAPMIDAIGAALRRWDEPSRAEGTLRIANRLFGERTYTFEQSFLSFTESSFAAPLESVDFRGATDASRVHINEWVAGHTNDHIRDLIPARAIDATTRLVLVNAIYLDARWQNPFERSATRPATFTLADGTAAQVDTMHGRASYAYGVVDGATIVELPYRGGELAMQLILPPAGTAPEAWATPERLLAETTLAETALALSIPKFRIEPGDPVSLRDHLTALGMPLAFERGTADFSGIASPPSPDDRLFVSDVLHKAFVRVDEDGTEAAAATAVVMARGGAAPSPGLEVSFDRPFLFVLREVASGAILFLGRVSDPR